MGERRLHVVHVIDSLQVGGTENGLVNLVGCLAGDFRHTVVAMTAGGPLAARLPAETALVVLGKRPGLDLRALGRLVGHFRRLRPDIVHSRNWGALDAVPAARIARSPIVVHGEHGREVTDPEGLNRRRNRIRRWLAPMIDRYVTVSLDLGRWLTQTVGIERGKVMTIHNGVDLRRFGDADREAGRAALGVDRDTVVLGTVGRLDPVKDQARLLEAYARIPAEAGRHCLVLVGDGPCRRDLEARAAQPDLRGRVHLLGERRDVPCLLAGFDVFALPSIAEGISNTVLEAMASGLPLVATRTGGNPELVEDGVTGRLVPVGDTAALTEALTGYVREGHLRAMHGKAGRQRAVDHFSLERMAERYRDLYANLARRDDLRRAG
jgi:sugar transferase (PEP-CTERM/EpsH1 system associated)